MKRFLTKSRFKLACECPTKLFYTAKKQYVNSKKDDSFLEALAEGGFQVGEFAKHHYPGGLDVTTLDYNQALKETNEYLTGKDFAVVYEAAVTYKNLFIRVDVLIKEGNTIRLIEVKAKSYDPRDSNPFLTKATKNQPQQYITSGWKPYLYDIAFQQYVVQKAFPNYEVTSRLMLTNKQGKALSEGVNQKFQIGLDKQVHCIGEITAEDIDSQLLIEVPVDGEVRLILDNRDQKIADKQSFDERVNYYAEAYEKDEKIPSKVASICGSCEFDCDTSIMTNNGLQSGRRECFSEQLGWQGSDFQEDTIFDLWNYRSKQKRIDEGKLKLQSMAHDDIGADEVKLGEPLSHKQRQWLQVEKSRFNDNSDYVDHTALKQEHDSWIYPLHFIDFETSRAALPFYKGKSPYEQLAFQFSHHVVYEDGRVEHKDQYLNTDSDFPNFDFVRALKFSLKNDEGTIFRYHNHENSVLREIRKQILTESNVLNDQAELIEFIDSITQEKGNKQKQSHKGKRNMVDLCKLVERYTYYTAAKGRSSIKVTLPAILNSSAFLKKKYSKPIYGINAEIPSLNFDSPISWINSFNGVVENPYNLLPNLFSDYDSEEIGQLERMVDGELNQGGAAMTAWAKMHFCMMHALEKEEIKKALLKYCELDTLAMVMIYEAWKAEI